MEVLVSLLGSLTMLIIASRAARRWAKSGLEAALWGFLAGVAAAIVLCVAVVVIYRFNPQIVFGPMLVMRLDLSFVTGPVAGALLTVMLWRRRAPGS
jgi:hypothetical protein